MSPFFRRLRLRAKHLIIELSHPRRTVVYYNDQRLPDDKAEAVATHMRAGFAELHKGMEAAFAKLKDAERAAREVS